MSEVTCYVALPFVPSDDGIAPGEAIECDFRFNNSDGSFPETDGTSFTFLGFCHVFPLPVLHGRASLMVV